MRKEKYIVSAKEQEKNKNFVKEHITVILLGENHGHRMKSYGPIPLIKVDTKTLLQKQVDAIKSVFPRYEIILCSGFDARKTTEYVKNNFKKDNIRIVENQLHYNSNCCESARLCLNNTMNTKILICSGNILLTPSYLSSIDYKKTSINVQQENFKSEFFLFIKGKNTGVKIDGGAKVEGVPKSDLAFGVGGKPTFFISYKHGAMFDPKGNELKAAFQ